MGRVATLGVVVVLAGCASAPPTATRFVYDGPLHISDGKVELQCDSRSWLGPETTRLRWTDLDGDERWDVDEPSTVIRRCPDRRAHAGSGPARSRPDTRHVVGEIRHRHDSKDDAGHLDKFIFDPGYGTAVVQNASGESETIERVTKVQFYANVVIIRAKDDDRGVIVPTDALIRLAW